MLQTFPATRSNSSTCNLQILHEFVQVLAEVRLPDQVLHDLLVNLVVLAQSRDASLVITLCSTMPLFVTPLHHLPPKPPGLISVTMSIILKCSSSNIFPVAWIASTTSDASS